jgi:hypothetical protein
MTPAEGTRVSTTSEPSEPTGPSEDEFRLDLLTLAEWALIGPDGRVTLGNAVTTTVQVPAMPAGLPPLYLAASVAAPPAWAGNQAQLAVRALDAAGRPVAADPLVSGTAAFPPSPQDAPAAPRLQFALQLTGLLVQSPGRLRFVLALAGDELGEVGLEVRLAPPPTTSVNPTA